MQLRKFAPIMALLAAGCAVKHDTDPTNFWGKPGYVSADCRTYKGYIDLQHGIVYFDLKDNGPGLDIIDLNPPHMGRKHTDYAIIADDANRKHRLVWEQLDAESYEKRANEILERNSDEFEKYDAAFKKLLKTPNRNKYMPSNELDNQCFPEYERNKEYYFDEW